MLLINCKVSLIIDGKNFFDQPIKARFIKKAFFAGLTIYQA